MKAKELFSVLDLEETFVIWIDKNGSHSLNSKWIPEKWSITKMYVDCDGALVVCVDGDFETL